MMEDLYLTEELPYVPPPYYYGAMQSPVVKKSSWWQSKQATWFLSCVLIVVIAAGIALIWQIMQPTAYTVNGELHLYDNTVANANCNSGGTDYSNIYAGQQVTISNDSGQTLAIADLDNGTEVSHSQDNETNECVYPFTATVQRVKFYVLTINGQDGVVREQGTQIETATVQIGTP